jgi:defect-in-organelle-trafficking protein DotC
MFIKTSKLPFLRFIMLKKTILSAVISCGLAAFSVNASEQQSHLDLTDLKDIEFTKSYSSNADPVGDSGVNLRLRAMKDAAIMVGAQHGYISQMNKRKNELLMIQDDMDALFDFGMIMRLSGGIIEEMYMLPPVIQEAKNVVAVSDDASEMRHTDHYYHIVTPARLVLSPPDWRQYLIFDQPTETTTPPEQLLPKTSEEKKLWEKWVEEGWTAGQIQGEREIVYRERALGRDFNGMLVYLRLTMQKGIKKPIVVSSYEDVTGGGNEMRIGEKVIKIASPGLLDPNADNWKPLVMDTRGSLAYPVEH